ncbi:MAG: hypothetical protein U0452_16070 [Anaerolineae bacterium]
MEGPDERPKLLDEPLDVEPGPEGPYGLPAPDAIGFDEDDERVSFSPFPPTPNRPSSPPPLSESLLLLGEAPGFVEGAADRLDDDAPLSSFLSPPRPNSPPRPPFLSPFPFESGFLSSGREDEAGDAGRLSGDEDVLELAGDDGPPGRVPDDMPEEDVLLLV